MRRALTRVEEALELDETSAPRVPQVPDEIRQASDDDAPQCDVVLARQLTPELGKIRQSRLQVRDVFAQALDAGPRLGLREIPDMPRCLCRERRAGLDAYQELGAPLLSLHQGFIECPIQFGPGDARLLTGDRALEGRVGLLVLPPFGEFELARGNGFVEILRHDQAQGLRLSEASFIGEAAEAPAELLRHAEAER